MKKVILLFLTVLLISDLTAQKSNTAKKIISANNSTAAIIVIENDRVIQQSTAWTISPQLNPDVFNAVIRKRATVKFVTDIDSTSYDIKPGDIIDFIVLLNDKDSAHTRITASKFTEAANFTKKYQKQNNNTITVEIPEVYELVNILFALTNKGISDSGFIEHGTTYYTQLRSWFNHYKNEKAVELFDSLTNANINNYHLLKMDAYSYMYNKKGKIVPNPIYNRTSWRDVNQLSPYITALQEFSNKTNSRMFYKKNIAFYKELQDYYKDSLDILEMKQWLLKNFPSSGYNAYKIILSPLVAGYQSANRISNSNFQEAHSHINFPYRRGAPYTGISARLRAGNIVFTEINHSFINPESEKQIYANDVAELCKNLNHWMEDWMVKNYNSSYSCFNEYMNWVLVNLRYVDYAPPAHLNDLIERNITYMTKNRGFKKFGEFSHFLVPLYQNRKPGKTVADLYPQIIQWFKNNQ
jgi:hypothetical protein